jgi:hypothetical protein
MRRMTIVVGALGLGLAASLALAQDKPCNVLIIGWDGCQRAHLQEMIARHEVPHLMTLARHGALVDMDISSGATDTKAGWAQILTGYGPDITGVYSNHVYQPIPQGYTIFERVEKALGPDNVFTAMILGKRGNVEAEGGKKIPYAQWEKAQIRKRQRKGQPAVAPKRVREGTVIEENGQKFVVIPGKPYLTAQKGMDLFVNGLNENEKVGTRAMAELEAHKDQRFLVFAQFADPDHTGHMTGENSQEYTDAIKSDDEWTGKIIAKLKDLGLYDNTLVYIVADHGFDEGEKHHNYAPYVFLATNDKAVQRKGDRADLAPTVLQRFGIDLATITPALTGISYDQEAPDRGVLGRLAAKKPKKHGKAKAGAAQG